MASIITNTEYKAHAQISASTWDAIITTLIAEIQAKAERRLGLAFTEATYTDELYDGAGMESIVLKNRPVTAVTAVKIKAGDGTTIRTLASTEYKWKATGRLELTPVNRGLNAGRTLGAEADFYTELHGMPGGSAFPDQFQNVAVTYTAGYASNAFPADLKLAMCLAVDFIFRRRGQDPTVKSESIGAYSISYSEFMGQNPGALLNSVVDEAFTDFGGVRL